jgi:hypothetical protein
MKVKLIKDHDEYMLINDERFVIATTDASMLEVTDKIKLSKQNCDEIFGVVDVEKLGNEYLFTNKHGITLKNGFIDGFNKAMELNKDKVFTLEDMFNLYAHIVKNGIISGEEANEFIQSLQQPTEIEVEIEMELEIDTSKLVGAIYGHKPKLDSEGCLILKRI